MPQCDVVVITNPPAALVDNRKAAYTIFNPFGKIFKLYADKNHYSFIKIYFNENESASAAVRELHEAPPHFLKLTIQKETVKPRNNILQFSSNFDECSSSHSNMGDEDIEASPGPRLYDVFGKEIVTFQTDDGQAFISVEELKKHNFECFSQAHIPCKITRDAFLHELLVYVSIKIKKFLLVHKQYEPKQQEIDNITNQVISKYTNIILDPVTTKHIENTNKNRDRPDNFHATTIINKNNDLIDNNNQVTGNSPQMNGITVKKTFSSNHGVKPRIRIPEYNTQEVSKSDPTSSNFTENSNKYPQRGGVRSKIKIPEYAIREIPLNTPLEVFVTHVVNERRCYVYLKSREQHQMKLLRRVHIEAMKSSAVTPEIGKIYAAQFENEWYRALVYSVNPLKVQYIDFGNENVVNEVRSLSNQLCEEPVEAVCINFGNNPINIPLQYGTILNIRAMSQNSDFSYQVVKNLDSVQKQEQKHESTAESDTKNFSNSKDMTKLHFTKSVVINEEKSETKDVESEKNNNNNKVPTTLHFIKRVVKSEEKPTGVEEKKKDSNKNQTVLGCLNPPRNIILDKYFDGTGILQYLNTFLDKNIVFLCPTQSLEFELTTIDNIGDVTSTDKNYKAEIGDCVAVYKEDESKWVRATVINKHAENYTIAMIDYGVIETTDVIRKLPKVIADIPEFSCICIGSQKFLTEMKENALEYNALDKTKIKVTYSDGTTECVTCSRWDPFIVNNMKEKIEVREKPEEIFTVPPKNRVLSQDEIVIISNFNDDKLLVRTKACQMSYTKLKQIISNYKATPLKKPPQLNQIALAAYENNQDLNRVIVRQIKGNSVEVDYIDLGIIDSIDTKSLRSVSENIAKNDITLITITLNGFENGGYSEEALLKIEEYCQNRTKFIAKNISNDVFDLIINDTKQSLSSLLKKCGRKDSRLTFEDLPKQELKTDKLNVLCINDERIADNIVFFFSTDKSIDLATISNVGKTLEENDPYAPVLDEICFAFFEGELCRARVLEADHDKDQYKVIFIDFGNEADVQSAGIRKMDEDLMTIAPIGLPCKIKDFNGQDVTNGESYFIKVLSTENGFYLVDLI